MAGISCWSRGGGIYLAESIGADCRSRTDRERDAILNEKEVTMIKVRPCFSYCIALLAPLMACGCASIMEGTTQSVTFNSEPSGAQVVINGVPMAVTPATITLKRREYEDATVIFKKDGFKDQQATLNTRLTNWFWGNMLTGGLLGTTTDAISGAMWEYDPGKYFVTLSPREASSAERARWDFQQKVQLFLLFSHEQLVADLARGGGESLSGLCALLDLTGDRQEAAIRELRILAVSAEDAPAFAQAVLRTFRNG